MDGWLLQPACGEKGSGSLHAVAEAWLSCWLTVSCRRLVAIAVSRLGGHGYAGARCQHQLRCACKIHTQETFQTLYHQNDHLYNYIILITSDMVMKRGLLPMLLMTVTWTLMSLKDIPQTMGCVSVACSSSFLRDSEVSSLSTCKAKKSEHLEQSNND